eukprot:scaffold4328_cov136-Skeletonema_marinoi.AAC.5
MEFVGRRFLLLATARQLMSRSPRRTCNLHIYPYGLPSSQAGSTKSKDGNCASFKLVIRRGSIES